MNIPTLPAALNAAIASHPGREALIYRDRTWTYSELGELVERIASACRARQIGPGTVVAMQLQSTPQFVASLFGAWRAGCIVVPINPMYRYGELAHVLTDSGATVVITDRGTYTDGMQQAAAECGVRWTFLTDDDDLASPRTEEQNPPRVVSDLLTDLPPDTGRVEWTIDPDAPALLSYTSGTSGPPKGAINTHANLAWSATRLVEHLRLEPAARVYAMAPLFHITGMVCEIGGCITLAGTLMVPGRFSPHVALQEFLQFEPHWTVGPSTAYIALLNAPGASPQHFASFQSASCGGAPLPPKVVDEFQRRFSLYLLNGYGLTETAAGCVSVQPEEPAPVDESSGTLSIGKVIAGTSLRVLDEFGQQLRAGELGELAISSPAVTPGYWNNPCATAAATRDGYFLTGDVGFVDQHGWVYLVDRKKDMIVSSGFKVWPREVEDVIYRLPGVREVAVVGVDDSYRGEAVAAYVSASAGHLVDPDAVKAHCRAHLAAYKCPRDVHVLDDLPKTVSGKILRRAFRSDESSANPSNP